MTNETKTPGAMVLVPREPTQEMLNGVCIHPDLARSLWSSMIRHAPAEQPPAVSGEPPVVGKLVPAGSGYDCWHPNANNGQAVILLDDHRAHVAPLLDEIELLKECIRNNALAAGARIAELEAAQGEAVYQSCNGVGGWIDVDRLRYTACQLEPEEYECRVLYRQAQPATAKVVLPERDALRDAIALAIGGDTYDCTRVWSAWGVGTMSDDDFVPITDQKERLYEIADACLYELSKLNGDAQ